MHVYVRVLPHPISCRMDNDFANFDDLVRSQHEEMDRQVWNYSSECRKGHLTSHEWFQMMSSMPQLPSWAVPNELKSKWPSPMLKHSEQGKEVRKDELELMKKNIALKTCIKFHHLVRCRSWQLRTNLDKSSRWPSMCPTIFQRNSRWPSRTTCSLCKRDTSPKTREPRPAWAPARSGNFRGSGLCPTLAGC